MHDILTSLAEHRPLTRSQTDGAMRMILSGEASDAQIAAFLVGLRARGETVEELVGLTEAMRSFAVPVAAPMQAVDIVGTGGDRSGTFNISTATSFVVAGTGVPVAKHGNRSVSSKCGAADVLEALGVRTELGRAGVEFCLERAGIAFLFAPYFHPAMKHVMPVRRGLGVRTCFNILGPMCNPAGVRRHLIGAFSETVAEMMAGILVELGSERVISVHATDGLDELSISSPTVLFRSLAPGAPPERLVVDPSSIGLSTAPLDAIAGGDADTNAGIIRDVLAGSPGAPRDVVLLNAAFALVAAGATDDAAEGLRIASDSLDSGRAAGALDALIEHSRKAPTETD
ncbi:MAG: anthranilate phosphoribosyltransferase [Rhodothermales bacterium]|nr:anthranilate phosphoribosyltransferase [Rhodothermales bacterium]